MGESRCRVIVNDRCLRNPQTGVGRYVTQLIRGLEQVATDVHVFPFYSWISGRRRSGLAEPLAESGSREKSSSEARPGQARSMWPLGAGPAQPRAGRWLRRAAQGLYETAFEVIGTAGGFRLYHEPNHIPMAWHGPIVTTIHDLSVLRHPEWHPADRVDWYEREFEAGLSRTHRFITVSQFTCDELVSRLGVDRSRITVIPLGVGAQFRPLPADQVAAWRARAGLTEPFLLFVGTLEPRKNVRGLLEAYAALPAELRERHPLVLAGMAGWGRDDVSAMARQHGVDGQVRLMGYVAEEALPLLYNAALALVWPTFYEGFGLPPLEAMACGTPVITSNVSSLPEVVGQAGLLVDPSSSAEIAEAMQRVLEDEDLRAALAQRGLERAAQFTWERCDMRHAEVYRDLAEA